MTGFDCKIYQLIIFLPEGFGAGREIKEKLLLTNPMRDSTFASKNFTASLTFSTFPSKDTTASLRPEVLLFSPRRVCSFVSSERRFWFALHVQLQLLNRGVWLFKENETVKRPSRTIGKSIIKEELSRFHLTSELHDCLSILYWVRILIGYIAQWYLRPYPLNVSLLEENHTRKLSINREEKSLRHVALVAKFLDENNFTN